MDLEQVPRAGARLHGARGRRGRSGRFGCRRGALVDAAHGRHVATRVPGEERSHRRRRSRRGSTPRFGGLVLVVTNPVDPLVTRLHRRTGLDRRRHPRVHDQRQPAACAPGSRRRSGCRRVGRRVGAGRARRPERAAARPRSRRRRSGAARRRNRSRSRSSTSGPGTCATSRSTRAARRPGRPGSRCPGWSRR